MNDRGVEQLVARWAHNPKVRGSNPLPATKKISSGRQLRCARAFLFYAETYRTVMLNHNVHYLYHRNV